MAVKEEEFLAPNDSDRWAQRLRAGVPLAGSWFGPLGALAGTVLGEYLATTLPNQRLDRLVQYVGNLRSKLSDDALEEILKIPEKVALFEEGLYAAGFTPYKDRIRKISAFILNGLSKEDINIDRESYLLNIIKNLSEIDYIILNFYAIRDTYIENDIEEYQLKHKDIFARGSPNSISERNVLWEKQAYLEGRKRHLNGLGLLLVMPTNIQRAHPEGLGIRGDLQAIYDYEIAKLNDQIKALREPRYGLTSLGQEVLSGVE